MTGKSSIVEKENAVELKIGDRVLVTGIRSGVTFKNESGKIVFEDLSDYLVEFDKADETNYHSGNGKCAKEKGFWITKSMCILNLETQNEEEPQDVEYWKCTKCTTSDRFTVGKTYKRYKSSECTIMKDDGESYEWVLHPNDFTGVEFILVPTFKTGDTVKIIANSNAHCFNIGEEVVLENIESEDCKPDYLVFRANIASGTRSWGNCVRTTDMELVVPTETTITIKVSATTTTLTDGSHTTSVVRYKRDKHDTEKAVHYVTEKYFYELNKKKRDELKKLEELEKKVPVVGDKVKVVSNGKTYSTYKDWFSIYNISTKYFLKWNECSAPRDGDTFEVIAIHPHTNCGNNLALIESQNRTYIIGIEGLKVTN